MSYFSNLAELKHSGVDFDLSVDSGVVRGCSEPDKEYGKTRGVLPLEVGYKKGHISLIPREEWPERIEYLEKHEATLQHRIDADWTHALTQNRCGYCWAYSVIGAMQTCASRDGEPYLRLAGAYPAAVISRGKDRGDWPVKAAAWIAKHGTCRLSEWGDCTCGGSSCKGPRSGCPARNMKNVNKVKDSGKNLKIDRFYEMPRRNFDAQASALLQQYPTASGWVGERAWCDGHAMQLTRLIRTKRHGYQLVPDNSWGKYKRRTPVNKAPTGGVVVISTKQIE